MKVKIINPRLFYKVGEVYEVTIEGDYYAVINKKYGELYLIEKSDCTIIPDEPGNRVPFDWEVWKEKGGKVYHKNNEVTQLTKFDVTIGEYKYAGVMDGSLFKFYESELTMSAPDEVYYVNKYKRSMSAPYRSIENAKYGNTSNALFILEINITKGACKVVHTYNEKV